MYTILSFLAGLVRDVEQKRLKDAFKRASTFGGMMTENLFSREVLGDGVPAAVSKVIII